MPTPFTHLATAQRLLLDPQIPADVRQLLQRERPAFLLGNIAADARVSGNITREATHFFRYDQPIERHPWQVMLTDHPSLSSIKTESQRVFLAGYAAHLAMDELWSIEMVKPHFFAAQWRDGKHRFLMLHIILIHMDERDYQCLEGWHRDELALAQPFDWTPFLTDAILADWRDFISQQLKPGTSQTLHVFGERIQVSPESLRKFLDDPSRMKRDLWSYVSKALLQRVETHMYVYARAQMLEFLASV